MAANDSLFAAAAAPADARPAAAEPAQPGASVSRGTMTQIHTFSALFWTAMFVLHTAQMVLMDSHESWRTIRWRIGMNVLAFALCIPLGGVVRRMLNRPFWQRLITIGGVAAPLALGYSSVGYLVWYKILKVGEMSSPPIIGIVIQAQYYCILFVLWSAFCSLIFYTAQLQERERSLLQAQVLARDAELKMLRYQINPHFLFNTLNAVSALIVTGQALAADAMIGKLARFFRNALSRESTAKVTLAEDIRVQVEYLNIELTRFPDRLNWSIRVEPGLERALVPHLILQPLFENAIKHGVARSATPVEIRLTATRGNGELIVHVENDAPSAQSSPVDEGVGLANVARRLITFYGSQATVHTSRRDGRFAVELRLPLELTL